MPARIGGLSAIAALLWSLCVLADHPQVAVCQPDSPTRLRQLAAQAEALPAAPRQHLSAYLQPARLSTLHQSADGQWLFYWRAEGQQYWLARSRGDGEEQVLLRQRQPFQYWQPTADQSGIWLADHDQLLFYDLKRQQLQKIWSAGTPLPGQRVIATAADSEIWQLEAAGGGFAVLHRYVNDQHQYWRLSRHSAAQLLYQQPWPLQSLWFTADGRLSALAQLHGSDEQTLLWQRPTPESPLQPGWQCPGGQFCRIRAVSPHGLWLAQSADTGSRVVSGQQLSWLPATAGAAPHPMLTLPADLTDVLLDPAGIPLAAANWSQQPGQLQQWQALQPAWQELLSQLQARWPATQLQLQLARYQTGWRLLVSVNRPTTNEAEHWWLTLSATLQMTHSQILALAPAMTDSKPGLASPQFICWRSADGQPVPAYLTLPTGRALAHSPLILLPHGGPWLQSTPEYDPLVQMLVAEGFIVLQPNYRGSAGYGQAWLSAAGALDRSPMLADLFSGLDWLLANQLGDAKQQLVLGHSFGAYLALQAVATAPGRFKAAIALAPPLQLATTWHQYIPRHDQNWRRRVRALALTLPTLGVALHNQHWQQQMQQQAIPAQLPRLPVPLYLWLGAQDERIDVTAVRQWAARLQATANTQPLAFYLDPAADHWPGAPLSRASLFYLIWQASRTQLQAAAVFNPATTPAAPATTVYQDITLDRLEQYLQEIRQHASNAQPSKQ